MLICHLCIFVAGVSTQISGHFYSRFFVDFWQFLIYYRCKSLTGFYVVQYILPGLACLFIFWTVCFKGHAFLIFMKLAYQFNHLCIIIFIL